MSLIPSPTQAVLRPYLLPGMWAILSAGVLLAGCSLGSFMMVSLWNEATFPYLVKLGGKFLDVCAHLPLCGFLFVHLHGNASPEWILLFPGLMVGALGIAALWLVMGMAAAWQNSTLFPSALKQVGGCLMPLILYLPLACVPVGERRWWFHWIAVAPFAISAFLLNGTLTRIRLEALGGNARVRMSSGNLHQPLAGAVVWMAALVAFVIWAALSQMRHSNFHSHCYDLALMSHILNRFLNGEGLTSSLIISGGSFLGHHFSPVLFLLLPFYYFGPHPDTLLWIQAAAVAFAAVPLFRCGEVLLGSSWTACAMALVYLFLPGLTGGICFDFHTISLAPLFFFWLAWEVVRGGSWRWWIPLLLLLLVQENLFIYSMALGIFLLLREAFTRWQMKREGQPEPQSLGRSGIPLAVTGLSLVYAVTVFLVIQPWIQAEAELGYGFVQRYQDFLPESADPAQMGVGALMGEILSHPGKVLGLLSTPIRVQVFTSFWGGTGFLPFWSPLSWILLAPVLEDSLSSDAALYAWDIHYVFGPAMVSALAMMASLSMFRYWQLTRAWLAPLSWTLLFSSILWWVGHSTGLVPAPFAYIQYGQRMEPEGTALILMTHTGTGQSAAAQSHLVPHLTHLAQLFLLPPSTPVAVVGASPEAPEFERLSPAAGWPDYMILDRNTPNPQAWYNLWYFDQAKVIQWVDWLVETGRYRKILGQGTLEIYERRGD